MIDIAFTESAHGSLTVAQSFGKGKYNGGCIGVLLHHEDGSQPTQKEIEEAQRRAEEQHRKEWEEALPLGGKASDVFGFPMGLSIGDIREPLNFQSRLDAMKIIHCPWDDFTAERIAEQYARIKEDFKIVFNRIASGEDARIWYSNCPDELCGLYWLMDALRDLPEGHGTLCILKMPEYEEQAESIRSFCSWGEVTPGSFGKYLNFAKPVSDLLRIHYFSNNWKQLQQENAPLRAVLNGKLISVSDDIYDVFIRDEICRQPETFWEAMVIGNVLGRYQLGIGDGIIHERIQQMVLRGELEDMSNEPDTGYRRHLKKCTNMKK